MHSRSCCTYQPTWATERYAFVIPAARRIARDQSHRVAGRSGPGKKRVIKQIGKKAVLEELEVDDILANLSPAKRRELQADANGDGFISREEAEKTILKDSFDSIDANKDGKISREEWDAVLKFLSEGKNSAFALKAGGSGDVTNSHVLWKKTKGLPYIPSVLVYQGEYVMVKDGGLVTTYDAKTGKEVYLQERVAAPSRYYAPPVSANGHIYCTSLEDGAVTVLNKRHNVKLAGLDMVAYRNRVQKVLLDIIEENETLQKIKAGKPVQESDLHPDRLRGGHPGVRLSPS